MTALPTRPCRKCGKPLVFAAITKADGAPGTMPLDARAPVYVATQRGDQVLAMRAGDAFVAHASTCPRVNDFSAKDGESVADENDRLREELRVARDRIAVLEAERRPT